MSHKAHPDCPNCACLRPDPDEEMQLFVNGVRIRSGTRTLKTGDQITYRFIKRSDPREAE